MLNELRQRFHAWWNTRPSRTTALEAHLADSVKHGLAIAQYWSTACHELEVRCKVAEERYTNLVTKVLEMKMAGFESPVPIVRYEKKEKDPVTQAIIARARGNPVLLRHFQGYVNEHRALGEDEDTIAQQILAGQTDD